MSVSEKKLCRELTKDALAHALVKIYYGADAKEIIEKMLKINSRSEKDGR